MMIAERMRDRAKFNTAVDPYRLLQDGADTIDALVAALEKISNVSFPGWEAQTAVDYCRSTADAALALARGEG